MVEPAEGNGPAERPSGGFFARRMQDANKGALILFLGFLVSIPFQLFSYGLVSLLGEHTNLPQKFLAALDTGICLWGLLVGVGLVYRSLESDKLAFGAKLIRGRKKPGIWMEYFAILALLLLFYADIIEFQWIVIGIVAMLGVRLFLHRPKAGDIPSTLSGNTAALSPPTAKKRLPPI